MGLNLKLRSAENKISLWVADGGRVSLSNITETRSYKSAESSNKNKTMVAVKTGYQIAKYLAANPGVVRSAYKTVSGYLTPPNSRRKRKRRTQMGRAGTRPDVRRRLNFSAPPPRRVGPIFGKRLSSRRGGFASSAMGRYHTGRNYFKADDVVPFAKASRSKVNEFLPFHEKGYVDSTEITGQVNDPDCVYIGHVAQCNLSTMFVMLRALFRKLFYECVKYDGLNANEEIPGLAFDDTSNIYKIVLLEKDQDTDAVTIKTSYVTAGNDTITSVVNQFINDFLNYANGYALYDVKYKKVLHKLQLYQQDGNVAQFWNFQGELNLQDLIVHVAATSSLKMQNRTKSATSGSDENDISNNPLIGRRYQMNNLPKVREDVGRFGAINNQGVRLIRAAELPAVAGLKEPPHPGYFVNTKSTTGVKLLPGEIKYGKLKYNVSMKFLKYLKHMRWDEDASSLSYYNVGPYELYGLEDAINVNGTEKIQIAYEVNRQTGVYFTTKKKRYSQGTNAQYVVNNTT